MVKSLEEVKADYLDRMTQRQEQEAQKQQRAGRTLMIANIALALSAMFLLFWYFK